MNRLFPGLAVVLRNKYLIPLGALLRRHPARAAVLAFLLALLAAFAWWTAALGA